MKYLTFLSSILILTLGCTSKPTSPEDQKNEVVATLDAEWLLYHTKQYDRSYGPCSSDTLFNCTQISVELPVFIGKTEGIIRLNDSVKMHLLNDFLPDSTVQMDVEAFMEGFINDYINFTEEFGMHTTGWFVHLRGEVLANHRNYLSVALEGDVYTGGAHGMHNLYFLNLDPTDVRPLQLSELLVAGSENKIRAAAERKFRDAYQINSEKSLNQDGGFTFQEDVFTVTDNYALLDSGLVFHYNSYEIAPYAVGPTQITLPYGEIADFLKPEFRRDHGL